MESQRAAVLRTVGRRQPARDGLLAGLALQRTANQFQRAFRTPGIPRGVYRFQTHEEANAWNDRMIARKPAQES